MKLTIEINMDNDAFNSPRELRKCLAQVADKIDRGAGKIMDTNGNSVGKWEVTDAE